MLRDQLRNTQPPISPAEISYHTDALESAIERIRGELAQSADARAETSRPRPNVRPAGDIAKIGGIRSATSAPRSLVTLMSIGAAVVAAAAAAGGYAYFASRHDTAPSPKIATQATPPPPAANTAVPPAPKAPSPARAANAPSPAPAPNKAEPAKEAAAPSLKRPKTLRKAATMPDGDLPPGVDGGSTDADVAFFLRRQPVFYRSTHPVGSIIVDKQQHFLYFIQPHQVALRYGIGVGKS